MHYRMFSSNLGVSTQQILVILLSSYQPKMSPYCQILWVKTAPALEEKAVILDAILSQRSAPY